MARLIRKGRFCPPRRDLIKDLADSATDPEIRDEAAQDVVSYREWLVRRAGRPMERALIRVEHRYRKLHPARIRASHLHRAYRSKRR